LDSEFDRKLKEWESSASAAGLSSPGVASSTTSQGGAKRGRSSGSKQPSSVDESDKRKGRPPKRKKPGLAPGADSYSGSAGSNGNSKLGTDSSAPVSPDSAPVARSGKGGPLDGLTFRIGKAVDSNDLQDMITNAGGMILQYITKHVRVKFCFFFFFLRFAVEILTWQSYADNTLLDDT
jgi:hypothetical protein